MAKKNVNVSISEKQSSKSLDRHHHPRVPEWASAEMKKMNPKKCGSPTSTEVDKIK